MATGYYQTPQAPRLYVSYPLFAYATGGLGYTKAESISKEETLSLIQLDPANYVEFNPDGNSEYFDFKCVPLDLNPEEEVDDGNWWNFNYCMILGHNLADLDAYPEVQAYQTQLNSNSAVRDASDPDGFPETISTGQDLVNFEGPYGVPYNGWSAFSLTDTPTNADVQWLRLRLRSTTTFNNKTLGLGAALWGKYWDAPQNVNLNTSLSYSYGIKQKTTKSGKSLTNINWTKPNSWVGGNEPFGLTDKYNVPTGDSHFRKTGKRTWKMSWDSLEPKYVMNQNPMLNSLGWEKKDNYQADANDESLYNIYNSNDGDSSLGDFYTDVIHKTLGGSLPMVLCLDKNDHSPSNMAIVKMTKPPTITQKSPNLYHITITLEEQI